MADISIIQKGDLDISSFNNDNTVNQGGISVKVSPADDNALVLRADGLHCSPFNTQLTSKFVVLPTTESNPAGNVFQIPDNTNYLEILAHVNTNGAVDIASTQTWTFGIFKAARVETTDDETGETIVSYTRNGDAISTFQVKRSGSLTTDDSNISIVCKSTFTVTGYVNLKRQLEAGLYMIAKTSGSALSLAVFDIAATQIDTLGGGDDNG